MQHLIGKPIIFQEKIEELEGYAEGGMRAVVEKITEEFSQFNISGDLADQVFIITFDYSDFEDYNKRLETSNYYGRDGVANLTAREADQYDIKEDFYLSSPVLFPFEDYFLLFNSNQLELSARFKTSGETDYVRWLEDIVDKRLQNDKETK